MKRTSLVNLAVVLLACLMTIFVQPASALVIGPGDLPPWHEQAQVQLGWVFSDPTQPENTDPEPGWNKAIGEIPTWSYDQNRVAYGNPAQWYIKVANVEMPNPVKHFWLSFVYGFDRERSGERTYTSIEWDPFSGYSDLGRTDEWFTATGDVTTDHEQARYGRMTFRYDLFPNPDYEEIWIGLPSETINSNLFVKEVYLKTQCVPLPGAVLLLGANLFRLAAYYRRRQDS